ncbi:hypothetical protein THAOC_00728 [Thalassiosira oceanica]|uniref:Uncharacterized protein n=1 Tax=Thalassiosira oceanica TaxID=159749 RepID=K0TJS4_THAOC|nr:hypothetical protein THAOC_00728 [Thalassiosira oceanica]|eukprot:EJK77444.1 hypothetical protein THAOC_00728 [Thalassiosira oceanica]
MTCHPRGPPAAPPAARKVLFSSNPASYKINEYFQIYLAKDFLLSCLGRIMINLFSLLVSPSIGCQFEDLQREVALGEVWIQVAVIIELRVRNLETHDVLDLKRLVRDGLRENRRHLSVERQADDDPPRTVLPSEDSTARGIEGRGPADPVELCAVPRDEFVPPPAAPARSLTSTPAHAVMSRVVPPLKGVLRMPTNPPPFTVVTMSVKRLSAISDRGVDLHPRDNADGLRAASDVSGVWFLHRSGLESVGALKRGRRSGPATY